MDILKFETVQDRIISVRGEQVIIDRDLAELYGVETRDINKALKNNPEKFPEGYVLELTKEEKAEVVEIFHHLELVRFSPHLPKAFTEKKFIYACHYSEESASYSNHTFNYRNLRQIKEFHEEY